MKISLLEQILEDAASQRGISVEQFKRQLTGGPVKVSADEVEQEYSEQASAFGVTSPDEAKERIRLALEDQQRMKLYSEALAELRKTARIEILPSRARAEIRALLLQLTIAPIQPAAQKATVIQAPVAVVPATRRPF